MMWLMPVVPASVVVDLDLVTEVTDRVDHTAHLVIDLTELLGLYALWILWFVVQSIMIGANNL